MDERRIVALLGDSLLMDSVEASLGGHPRGATTPWAQVELAVVRIHSNIRDVTTLLKCLAPDVVIFDMDAPCADFVVPFLRDQPGVPLLGLDLVCSRVIVLTSKRYTTLSAQELAHVIELQASGEAGQQQSNGKAIHDQVRELLEQWT